LKSEKIPLLLPEKKVTNTDKLEIHKTRKESRSRLRMASSARLRQLVVNILKTVSLFWDGNYSTEILICQEGF